MLIERERERVLSTKKEVRNVLTGVQRKGQEAQVGAGADYSSSASHQKQITVYSSEQIYLEHYLRRHETFLPHDDHVAVRKADAVLWKCWIFPCLGVA